MGSLGHILLNIDFNTFAWHIVKVYKSLNTRFLSDKCRLIQRAISRSEIISMACVAAAVACQVRTVPLISREATNKRKCG